MHLVSQVETAVPPHEDAPRGPRALRPRRLLGGVGWGDDHRRLAAQPMLRDCRPGDIRQLARVGDQCSAPVGTVLCRERGIGYWFFIVLDGSIHLSLGGEVVTTLGPGAHFGEIAILGFGPQPMTATAAEDSVVYVLGRRHLLDLCHGMPSLRQGLFPDATYPGFLATVRRLRDEGLQEWRRIQRETPNPKPAPGQRLPSALSVLPSRPRLTGSALEAFLVLVRPGSDGRDVTAAIKPVVDVPMRVRLTRRTMAAVVAVMVAAIGVGGSAYHPAILVVRPTAALDITDDVTVVGMPVHRPSGRYIITPVQISQPNLFGAARAHLTRQHTIPAPDVDVREARRAGREEYLDSQLDAVRLIASRSGVDPASIEVRFRDRELTGPSAGLVYALLLADMTGQMDVADGRRVAATGVIADDGRVLSVGFVQIKRRVADRVGADVFVVPAGGAADPSMVPAATFHDAVRAISLDATHTGTDRQRTAEDAAPATSLSSSR